MGSALKKFVHDRNLARFKALISAAPSGADRTILLTLLAEERAKEAEAEELTQGLP